MPYAPAGDGSESRRPTRAALEFPDGRAGGEGHGGFALQGSARALFEISAAAGHGVLGKEIDLDGKVVNQGLAVYGNKGSTDQHAYVQQLREGVLNFFVVFIEVLKDRPGASLEVEPGVTSGDYLSGFFLEHATPCSRRKGRASP
jgi:hypothetical protein